MFDFITFNTVTITLIVMSLVHYGIVSIFRTSIMKISDENLSASIIAAWVVNLCWLAVTIIAAFIDYKATLTWLLWSLVLGVVLTAIGIASIKLGYTRIGFAILGPQALRF